MSRPEALAAALESRGYTCTVEDRRVHVQAPAYTLSHVRLDEDGYVCVFDANELFAQPRANVTAWRAWVKALRTATGEIFPRIAHLPLPAAVVEPAPVPVPFDSDSLLDTYPHGPAVSDRCRHAWDEIREGRFAVYALHEAPSWSSMSADDLAWEGLAIGWHAWAEPVAVELGAAAGWSKIEGDTVTDSHPAHAPVEHILLAAAEQLPPPAGLVALDLRGLTPRISEQLVTALVRAARARTESEGLVRGTVVLCDTHTAACLTRHVDLDLH